MKYHHDKELLVLLNTWDNGSSRLEACGYKAVATTSMGIAAALGYLIVRSFNSLKCWT
ncbi:MAG: isocitrate lyase/phosphoenolpyruvate mutase family protein [Bacteroidia bacterium]